MNRLKPLHLHDAVKSVEKRLKYSRNGESSRGSQVARCILEKQGEMPALPLVSAFFKTPKKVNQTKNQLVRRFRRGSPKIMESTFKDNRKVIQGPKKTSDLNAILPYGKDGKRPISRPLRVPLVNAINLSSNWNPLESTLQVTKSRLIWSTIYIVSHDLKLQGL